MYQRRIIGEFYARMDLVDVAQEWNFGTDYEKEWKIWINDETWLQTLYNFDCPSKKGVRWREESWGRQRAGDGGSLGAKICFVWPKMAVTTSKITLQVWPGATEKYPFWGWKSIFSNERIFLTDFYTHSIIFISRLLHKIDSICTISVRVHLKICIPFPKEMFSGTKHLYR